MAIKHDKLLPNGRCPLCGAKPNIGEGRRLSLTQSQIEEILIHYIAPHPKIPQKEFCKINGNIGLKTYWKVTRLRLKHPKDREKVVAAAEAIGYDILSVIK